MRRSRREEASVAQASWGMGCLKSRKAKGKQSEMGAAGVSAKQMQSPRSAALISGEQSAQGHRNGSRKGAMPTSQSTAPQDTILMDTIDDRAESQRQEHAHLNSD